MLTVEWIKNHNLLVFEVITGSKAYGLDTASSDTDIRGVFVLPKEMYYGLEYTAQVSNESNDIVYYELKRFVELLSKNNPTIMEMLSVPENKILFRHPMMDKFKPELFLSRLCEKSFANYAYTQIKKAYGLEKKIVNPVEKDRKSILDFCFVYENGKAIPFKTFLTEKGLVQSWFGLSVIDHMKDCYNLYYSKRINYSGVIKKEDSNDVCLSSIPKGELPVGILYFNKDGYSVYCKQYREYWDWVEKRNEARFKTTVTHRKKYDSKNMMHVFRLLLMAKEIAVEGKINVFRKDRDYLLKIKQGAYEYEELLQKAEALKEELPALYQQSVLPEIPDITSINALLVQWREDYYSNDRNGKILINMNKKS